MFEGSVVSGESQPIDDGSYFFTEYTITLTRVFRSPPGRSLRVGTPVVVGTPGGEMTVEGFAIHATSNRNPRLARGAEYVLFARYNREYRVFHSSEPVFLVSNGRVAALAPSFLPFITDVPASDRASMSQPQFENRLHTVATACR